MKIVNISGMRGCGKTSLIRTLIQRLGARGMRSAVIVNEDGEAAYDPAFLQNHVVAAEFVRGG